LDEETPLEEKMYDQVSCYLYKRPLEEARKEFYLNLFAEWAKENLDTVFKATINKNSLK
jgi:hypothetical protein